MLLDNGYSPEVAEPLSRSHVGALVLQRIESATIFGSSREPRQ
jgi:hypothetical protein